jgi:osmoprotectant transport system permease protein
MSKLQRDGTAKHFILAAVFFAAGLVFPLYVIRKNRIVDGISFNFFQLGLTPASVLLFCLCAITVTCIILPHKTVRNIVVQLGPPIGFSALFLLFDELNYRYAALLGVPGRIGIGIALICMFLGLLALAYAEPLSVQKRAIQILIPVAVAIILAVSGGYTQLGIVKEFRNQESRFIVETINHLRLSGEAVFAGIVFGIPLGSIAYRRPSLKQGIFTVLNITQTIPALALFGLMIIPLSSLSHALPFLRDIGVRGIGDTPAVIALWLYALLPIARNTYVGYEQIPRSAIDAARGMGLKPAEIRNKIEFPLASPIILNGIRVASIQTIGNATLAKLVGGSGLGVFVFEGLGQASVDMVLLGMTAIVICTFVVDALARLIIYLITPKAFRPEKDQSLKDLPASALESPDAGQ